MATTFRSEAESFPEIPQDPRSADETAGQSQPRRANREQTRRWQTIAARLLPTFAICGPSTNRFARFSPQGLRAHLHLHSWAELYDPASVRARPNEQGSIR